MSAATEVKSPAPVTEGCRYCWMCRQSCPVGHVTARETFTPHAWALTIESVKRGQLQWNAETVDVLYTCADCGLCRAHCATDQPLPDAIAKARADVAGLGQAPALVYEIEEKLKQHANPYAAASPSSGGAQGAVAVFIGDAGAHLSPATTEAAMTLLKAAGISAVLVGVGRSTGLLASSLGLPATATSLAHAVLAEVAAAGCQELLVLSPGDRFAFERVYPDRLGITWPSGVVLKDVTTVLAGALAAGTLKLRPLEGASPYAYHDPCHSPRIDRDAAAPRTLLAAVLGEGPARRLFWREQRAHPCGATGGLELTQPAVAALLADARLADAAGAGAEWLLTDDPSCLHHLKGREQAGLEVRGLYELLAAQIVR